MASNDKKLRLDLVNRPRRLRKKKAIRDMIAENRVSIDDLIYPYFIRSGSDVIKPIDAMPGISQFSVDTFFNDLAPLVEQGLRSIILFGIPDEKNEEGDGAWSENGPVPNAIRRVKKEFSELVVMADVCLCEYTDHGHCGPLDKESDGHVINDQACELYGRVAVAYAQAGADFVAPSGMMDGMVASIREALDDEDFDETAIMAYSAKYASNFYGPFREAAESLPQFGDRRSYQMDPANSRESMREVSLDLEEGADIVMVKPALAYLDIVRMVRDSVDLPVAAYNVSGEYSMIKGAIANGWVSEDIILETLTSIKRSGADLILTYFVKDFLRVYGNHS
ncbi:MAG: porphobilinogen synthase [Candidatus Lindowbacteria bacterium]|nr:porphobilinogen synthase [Candidatus Lindowbacteria bacterium]